MDLITNVDFGIVAAIEKQLNEKGIETSKIGVVRDIAYKIAAIQNTKKPVLSNPTLILLASDQGISKVLNTYLESNKSLTHLLSKASVLKAYNSTKEVAVKFVDIGLQEGIQDHLPIKKHKIKQGTNNFIETPAMEYSDYEKCLAIGKTIVTNKWEANSTIIGFGSIGAENKLPAALITSNLTNTPIEECIFFNPELGKEYAKTRLELLQTAQQKYAPMTLTEIITSYGSFEIAVLAGAYLKATALKMTILIDGFVSAAALLYAYQLNEHVLEYCVFCNQSSDKGQGVIIDYFEKQTILKLDVSSESGLGILMAYPIIKGSVGWLSSVLQDTKNHS